MEGQLGGRFGRLVGRDAQAAGVWPAGRVHSRPAMRDRLTQRAHLPDPCCHWEASPSASCAVAAIPCSSPLTTLHPP